MINDLYQETILDHSKRPRNFQLLEDASRKAEGYNPLCGDRCKVFLKEHGGVIDKVGALEMGRAARDLLSEVESIQTTDHGQAMIHGSRSRLGLLTQLMTDIIQQGGLGDFRKSLGLALKPPSEVQQVIGIGAEGARRQLTKMLGVEEVVGPGNLLVLIIEQAIRTGSGLMGQDQPHNRCARSRQSVKSAAVAPATK